MRSVCILSLVFAIACGEPGAPGAVPSDDSQPPHEAAAWESSGQAADDNPADHVTACAYPESGLAVELTPGDYCRIEHRDADGSLVARVKRTVATLNDVKTVAVQTYGQNGVLLERSTLAVGPHGQAWTGLWRTGCYRPWRRGPTPTEYRLRGAKFRI